MHHLEACDALEGEIDRFAVALEDADPSSGVPTCPAWSIAELTEHLGTIHRWANLLVARRSPERLSFELVDTGPGPHDAAWLRQGGSALLATLRAADPDGPMWAWGADQHARFWSRRQLHETLVHRVDLELALGRSPVVDPALAEDAIDEFLVNLKAAERFSPRVRELRGRGEVVAFRSTASSRTWRLRLDADGFVVLAEQSPADAELSGPADELLLIVTRRRSLGDGALELTGELSLMDFWLSHSQLE